MDILSLFGFSLKLTLYKLLVKVHKICCKSACFSSFYIKFIIEFATCWKTFCVMKKVMFYQYSVIVVSSRWKGYYILIASHYFQTSNYNVSICFDRWRNGLNCTSN